MYLPLLSLSPEKVTCDFVGDVMLSSAGVEEAAEAAAEGKEMPREEAAEAAAAEAAAAEAAAEGKEGKETPRVSGEDISGGESIGSSAGGASVAMRPLEATDVPRSSIGAGEAVRCGRISYERRDGEANKGGSERREMQFVCARAGDEECARERGPA